MSFFAKDIAVDLGTANTLVYVRGEGIVVNEPSIVTIQRNTNEIYAIGLEAKALLGKTPESYTTIRPLKDGVIADFDATERMLRYFINKAHRPNLLSKPRIIVCVPSGVTTVERRAVVEAAEQAGARTAYLVEEPVAAAIGANMPIESPVGNIIVDIGGGTTEVAVISMGGIVVSKSIRIAGDEMDEAIINYFRKEHNILLGQGIAEEIKLEIGSAFPLEKEEKVEVNGRDLLTGLPRKVVITSQMVRKALEDPVSSIIHAIQETLSATPPELSADIMERGIALTGGGSLLLGLSHRVSHDTNCPAYVVDQPLSAVVLGSGKCLEELSKYKDLISVYGR